MPDPAVVVTGLRKTYGSMEAVKGITFSIPHGMIFGFLGPNGAGKSTTMRTLYGGADPSSGSVTVLGLDATRRSSEVKRRIGIVPQELNLEETLTAKENLVTYARFFGIAPPAARVRADALLADVGLRDRADANVRVLSGGMRRRLLIARALMSDPELLVLDEPTTGLDPQSRSLLWERIRAMRTEGRTVILTTHYMDEAEKLCDRLVIIDHGEIIAEGTPKELIAREIGRDVVEVVADADGLRRVRDAIGPSARGHETWSDSLLLHTDDGEALMNRVTATGIPVKSALFRRASLEDVFLKLTGRRLEE